jgi:hypothetical protein
MLPVGSITLIEHALNWGPVPNMELSRFYHSCFRVAGKPNIQHGATHFRRKIRDFGHSWMMQAILSPMASHQGAYTLLASIVSAELPHSGNQA